MAGVKKALAIGHFCGDRIAKIFAAASGFFSATLLAGRVLIFKT
jgi:hypothetical protein